MFSLYIIFFLMFEFLGVNPTLFEKSNLLFKKNDSKQKNRLVKSGLLLKRITKAIKLISGQHLFFPVRKIQ